MDLNFDYRDFQRDTMERLARVYAESLEDSQPDVNEADETFNKIQKILDCQQMEKCHPYLFTLDRANVNSEDKKKIDALYECGVKRGLIKEIENKTTPDDNVSEDCDYDDSPLCGGPEDSLTNQPLTQQPSQGVETRPTFNVLYSAMKDGSVKMGEFYSLAGTDSGAKEDCINQLQSAGYNNISIMAVEQNTNAVNIDIEETPAGTNLYGNMMEDDSEEFEKQETGDTSDSTTQTDANTDTEASDSTETPEEKTGEGSGEEKSDTEEDAKDGEGNGSDEEPKDNKSNDTEDTEGEPEKEETNDTEPEEDSEEDTEEKPDTEDEEKDEEKKLTADEKRSLKDEYTKTFKNVLAKVSEEKSLSEMTITEKNDFYTKLTEKWTREDPSEFMSDKDQDKLSKFIAKPEKKAK